jgi:hypothetical protein
MLSEGVAAIAAVCHDPDRHAGQAREQRHGAGQFMRLTWREGEGDGPAPAVGNHAGLGAIAATRTAKRLTRTPLRRSEAFAAAPAAFWWARMDVPSRKAMPSSTPRACAIPSSRSHTPSRDQRMKVCAAIHQGPNSSGKARHFAPFWCRQMMAEIVRRRLLGGTFACGRHASTSGSSTAHSSSVSPKAALQKGGSTPATPQRSGTNGP